MERAIGKSLTRAIALMHWLEAVLFLGLGFAVLYTDSAFVARPSTLAAAALLALGALCLISGAGLWQFRGWARILALALAALSLLAFPFGTVIGVMAIWLLGFNSDVARLFG